MIITIQPNNFTIDNVFFHEQNKNNMTDSNFIRIIYSSKTFTLNGIFLYIQIQNLKQEKIFNKYKYTFSIKENNQLISFIQELESYIMNQISNHPFHFNKEPNYKLSEQFNNGELKMYKTNEEKIHNHFILKISGIWSTNEYYGITYKIFNHP